MSSCCISSLDKLLSCNEIKKRKKRKRYGSYLDFPEKVLNYFFFVLGCCLHVYYVGLFVCLVITGMYVCVCSPPVIQCLRGQKRAWTPFIHLSNKMAVGGKCSGSSYLQLRVISKNALKHTALPLI